MPSLKNWKLVLEGMFPQHFGILSDLYFGQIICCFFFFTYLHELNWLYSFELSLGYPMISQQKKASYSTINANGNYQGDYNSSP